MALAVAAAVVSLIEPANAAVVNDSGPATYYDRVTAVAGSASQLIYLRQQSVARFPAYAPTHERPERIIARTKDGTERTLGQTDFDDTAWSLEGDTLTAEKPIAGASLPGVAWWRTDSNDHGVDTLPAGQTYLSAGPGGYLTADTDGGVTLNPIGDAGQPLGKPFGTGTTVTAGDAGDDGVVVQAPKAQGIQFEYMAWSQPGEWTALTETTDAAVPDTDLKYCATPNGGYLACGGPRATVIPLDGTTPTAVAPASQYPMYPDQVGNIGATMAVASFPDAGWTYFRAGSTKPVLTPELKPSFHTPSFEPLVNAFGEMVGETGEDYSPGPFTLAALDQAGTTNTIVDAVRSPVAVAEFELLPGAIVDIDDQPDPAHPEAPDVMRSRSVALAGGSLAVGNPTVMHTMRYGEPEWSARYPRPPLMLGGDSTILLPTGRSYRVGHYGETLRRFSVGHTTTPVGVSDGWYVFHSQHNALARRVSDGGRVGHRPGGTAAFNGGHRVVITTGQDVVIWNLRTNADHPVPRAHGSPTAIWSHWIGWNTSGGHGRILNLRNQRPAIHLARTLVSLGPSGAIECSDCLDVVASWPTANQPATTSAWLRGYGGKERQLLPFATYGEAPQVADGIVAWLDSDYQLQAEPLPDLVSPRRQQPPVR
jgi:hypothetical protein